MIADLMEATRPGWAELIRLESAAEEDTGSAIESVETIRNRRRLIAQQERTHGAWSRSLFDWDWQEGMVERLESTIRGWQRLSAEPRIDPVLACWSEGRLRLSMGEEPAAAEILAQFPHWTRLSVVSQARFDVERFLRHCPANRLIRLDLSGLEIEGGSIRGMAASGLLGHLRSLDLSRCPTVGDRAARDLAEVGSPSLEELDLSASNLTRAGLTALLHSTGFPNLRVLKVDLFEQEKANHDRGHDLRRAIEHSPLWRTLEALDLNGIHLQPHEWEALADLPEWRRLRRVGLARAFPGPHLISKLASSSTLESLDLAGNHLHGGSLLEWTAAGRPPRLTALRLDDNPIADKAMISLAKTGWFSGLKQLEIRSIEIGKPGLTRLAEAVANHRVERFAAGGNFLGDVSLPALLEALGPVDELHLGGTSVDEPIARTLKERIPPTVRRLTLGPVALGLELSHTWKEPGRLEHLDVLGVLRAQSAMAADRQDLTRLLDAWPAPGLTKIVDETGTIARRRPGKPRPTSSA